MTKIENSINLSSSPSCPIVLSDGIASLKGTGRCDYGIEDIIASTKIAQSSVLKVNGHSKVIGPFNIQVTFTVTKELETFTFYGLWKVLRLALELSAGHLELLNV